MITFRNKLSLLFIILALGLFGQELRFSHISGENQLSQGIVNAITKDAKGYIWIGTQAGLNVYNGYDVKILKPNPKDSNSISNGWITCILRTNDGRMIVGTQYGLNIYLPEKDHFVRPDQDVLKKQEIRCIYQLNDGRLAIGVKDKFILYDLGSNELLEFNIPDRFSSKELQKHVMAIVQDDLGEIWIGTNGNFLYKFDKHEGKVKLFEHPFTYELLKEEELRVYDLVFDKRFGVIVGTSVGMLIYNQKEELTHAFTNRFSYAVHGEDHNKLTSTGERNINRSRVSCIVTDEDGIWVGTYGNGINYINNNMKVQWSITASRAEKGLKNNVINCFMVDENGLWIGHDDGVNMLFANANKFDLNNGFGPNGESVNVFSLLKTKDGRLWIGTNGLGIISKGVDERFNYHTNVGTGGEESVLSLHSTGNNLWIGTWGDGLSKYDLEKDKIEERFILKSSTSGSDGDVLDIDEDKKGNLWMGTYGDGLYRLEIKTGEIKQFTRQDGLNGIFIYCIYLDEQDRVWIGYANSGFDIFDPSTGQVKHFEHVDGDLSSLSSNLVNCIVKDSKERIWIATSIGLNLFDESKGEFTQYFQADGLPDDYIYGIVEDSKGKLWLSTNDGIVEFNPDIKNVAGSAFQHYQESDGLQGKEFNQGAFYKDVDGQLFFGGTNGYNAFYPDNIITNTHVPEVYVTGFKVFDKTYKTDSLISNERHIELSYKQNYITIEFVGLDYLNPDQNMYSYKLVNLEDKWSLPSTARFAKYPQLDPGSYIFKVKACNSDGVWNETGAEIYITIVPPFWKTKWFYALCVLLFIAGVIGFIRWRTGAIKKEKRVLEVKVEERTKELAEKNRDITSSIQYAKRIQEAILPSLESIYKHFPDAFVLYKPKDIVSGDFYWFAKKNGKKVIAAVDCTGHGVPGAFMSMIGHNLLNQIVVENDITDPALILSELHKGVQAALKQGSNIVDTSDGMDVALCVFDEDLKQVSFAGAFRPLFILGKDGIERVKGTKAPIGGSQLDLDRTFTSHTRFLTEGDSIFMFSDGYADQFGGEKGKKFMLKRFSDLLLSIKGKGLKEQGDILEKEIMAWMGAHEQVDDILVMGIRV